MATQSAISNAGFPNSTLFSKLSALPIDGRTDFLKHSHYKYNMKKLLLQIGFALFSVSSFAQYGVSAGSLSYTRSSSNQNLRSEMKNNTRNIISMPKPSAFIVEDFINYHKHKITIPRNEDIALSIDYDNTLSGNCNEFILQIGVATQPANLRDNNKNKVNVSLVLDVSGSMTGSKIASAKEAMLRFAQSLNDDSYLAITLFDDKAWVVLPSTKLTKDRNKIYSTIKNIEANGYTNLNAGMMLGYKEAMKHHSAEVNSRVILLTDGETNTGECNHNKIVQNSSTCNQNGINISTIGVGQSLDFDLLRQLAEIGRGSNYFIGENPEDMEKVFQQELDALLYNVGKNTNLTIELPRGWSIVKTYGYQPQSEGRNMATFNLPNLNASSTQIILMKVKRPNYGMNNTITASLKYTQQEKQIVVAEETEYSSEKNYTSVEIFKNTEIAFMAQNLKDAAQAYSQGNSFKTKSILEDTAEWMKNSKNNTDEDFIRVYDILKSYIPPKKTACERPYRSIF